MSVWIFVGLARIIHATTPPELARGVELLNILALLLLAFFSLYLLPKVERPPWLWATAFAAVNPFAVLFDRKIWAQSTLPLLCVLMWMAWQYRHKRSGAFCWGLLGICAGQIHMSGFFLPAGVFLWTLLHDRKAKWGSWLLGSLAGFIPLIPWLQYMATKPPGGPSTLSPSWILYPKYWIFWATDSVGLGLAYNLRTHQFMDFLRYPLIEDTPTYLVGVLHLVVLVAGIYLLVSAVRKGGVFRGIGDKSETELALHSVLIATGLLMTLSCIEVCRHYLIMTFPLEWVWLSRLGEGGAGLNQRTLAVIWSAQLLITALVLYYLHVNHGAPLGYYGMAYQYQLH
jgi:hypothetical protein